MKNLTARARRAFRLATVMTTALAVVACGSGSDSDGPPPEPLIQSEGVQSFAGTVSCQSIDGTRPSQSWETRVTLDRPVYQGMNGVVSRAAAVQAGGLAGSIVADGRSQISGTIISSQYGTAAGVIDFKVTASPTSGTYDETGRWTLGVDQNGKTTLAGESTAVLGPDADGWRASCQWNLAAAQAPVGPVSLGDTENRFGTPPASPVLLGSSGGGCGERWGIITTGAYTVAAIAAVPTGGASIAAMLTVGAIATGAAGGAAGSACLNSELAAMNAQLQTQAAQIQQIDNYLGKETNVLYQEFWKLQVEQDQTVAYLWQNAVNGISPAGSSPGLFGKFMSPAGLRLWTDYPYSVAAAAPTDPQQLALDDIAYDNARSLAGANGTAFSRSLKELSGTDVVVPSGSTCAPDPTVCVVPAPFSALIDLHRDLFSSLQLKIEDYVRAGQTPSVPSPKNLNVVPLYDDYNAMLVKFWTQSLYAMQQALVMEWTVNQMNYFRATSTTATQKPPIASWGGIKGTHYEYGNQSLDVETARYNSAQKNLAKLYAARVNQLYLNTLNYIISDVPVSPQAYPIDPVSYTVCKPAASPTDPCTNVVYTEKAIDYSGQMGKSITSVGGEQGRTPLSLIPSVATPPGAPWPSKTVLYQFSGLKDVAACLTSLQAYTASTTGGTVDGWLQTPNACPTIFTLADGSPLSYTCDPNDPSQCKGSVYDGNTLQPFTTYLAPPDSSGNPQLWLAGKMTNNLQLCDSQSPALGWYTPTGSRAGNAAGLVAGAAYLNCGRWYTPRYPGTPFPRSNPPLALVLLQNPTSAPYIAPGAGGIAPPSSVEAHVTSKQGSGGLCGQNDTSVNGNKYPFLISLLDTFPAEMQQNSCGVLNVSEIPNNSLTNARNEAGNRWTGSAAGCSVGYIGSGLNNALPKDTSRSSVGVRLPNATDSGGAGVNTGFVLPVEFGATCDGGIIDSFFKIPAPTAGISDYGFLIASTSLEFDDVDGLTYAVTLLDGTQYLVNLASNHYYQSNGIFNEGFPFRSKWQVSVVPP